MRKYGIRIGINELPTDYEHINYKGYIICLERTIRVSGFRINGVHLITRVLLIDDVILDLRQYSDTTNKKNRINKAKEVIDKIINNE